MKAVLTSLLTLPLVLIGSLTLPVSGSSLQSGSAEYNYRRPLISVTPATRRRRKEEVESNGEQKMASTTKGGQAIQRDNIIDLSNPLID
jgi:hypothetical protein